MQQDGQVLLKVLLARLGTGDEADPVGTAAWRVGHAGEELAANGLPVDGVRQV